MRLLLSSAVALTVLGAGCADDSSPTIDAAACSCPAAEAPIASRIRKVTQVVTVPAPEPPTPDGRAGTTASCPNGSIVLTGGCMARDGQRTDVLLEQAYASIANGSGAWLCDWKNLGTEPFSATAVAYCLMPE